MRVKVLIRHYRDGIRLAAGELVDMPDIEALDLICMGYVERVKPTIGRPPKSGLDRMINTKGA